MPEGQWTWREGKLVPLTEELQAEDLKRASKGFVDVPGENPRALSRREKRRAKRHMYDGEPWYVVALKNFMDLFGSMPRDR